MCRFARMLFLCSISVVVWTQQASGAPQRLALVIGNDRYPDAPLRNARSDARAIARPLQNMGFDVLLHTDLTDVAARAATENFKARLRPGSEALFYFSGHGAELRGVSYLIPVNASPNDSESRFRQRALSVTQVLEGLSEKNVRFAVAIIDACRAELIGPRVAGRRFGSSSDEAPSLPATGQMILYAAGVGQIALDRISEDDRDPNGLFTRVLLKEMQRPGVPIDRVLKNVRQEVVQIAKSIGHEQVPALYDQSIGEFYFRSPPLGTQQSSAVPTIDPEAYRIERLAAARDPVAQMQMGIFREHGLRGVPKDEAEALKWYMLSAAQGNAAALVNLGLMHETGRGGLRKDLAEAARMYRAAAELGNPVGQVNLGWMFEQGQGVAKDVQTAVALYQRAAAQGNDRALASLTRLQVQYGARR